MLTDLSFLTHGAPWPPTSEKERMRQYADNRKLFEADHVGVKSGAFKEAFARVMRDIGAAGAIAPISYEMVVNYPRLISVTTAGLLFNKAPGIIAGEEADVNAMRAVRDIDERSDLQGVLYACALDVSRYGTGLLYVHRDDDGQGVVDITRPDVWYPVVDGANIRKTLCHVLATPYTAQSTTLGFTVTRHYLRVNIHSKGQVETRDYELKDGVQIGAMAGTPRVEPTGLDDFAVIPVHNLLPSDRVFGIDDYADIQSLVCEVEVRLAQIAKVLDRHSDPTMQGPADAMTEIELPDGSTTRQFIPGQYFINQSGEIKGEISYITWEAQLEANFKYIDKIIELIRTISEMGALLSDLSEKAGNVPSGAAMRRMLYSAVSKVARIRNHFAPAIKKAFKLASALSGDSLMDKALYIDWPDSLPRDPLEMAQVAQIRTGAKQTQSVKRAIMDLDELSESDAEAELESIRDDEAEALPGLDGLPSEPKGGGDE